MKWYVLRNRRHVGPFEDTELRRLLESQKISPQDYLLSEEDADKGAVSYVSVHQVLKVDSSVMPVAPRKSVATSNAPEETGAFSKEEVTKLFEEEVDPVDLATFNIRRQEEARGGGPIESEAQLTQETRESSSVQQLVENISKKFESNWFSSAQKLLPAGLVLIAVFGVAKVFMSDSSVGNDKAKNAASANVAARGAGERGPRPAGVSPGRAADNSTQVSGFSSTGSAPQQVGQKNSLRVPKVNEAPAQPRSSAPQVRVRSTPRTNERDPEEFVNEAEEAERSEGGSAVSGRSLDPNETVRNRELVKRRSRTIEGQVDEYPDDYNAPYEEGPSPASEEESEDGDIYSDEQDGEDYDSQESEESGDY